MLKNKTPIAKLLILTIAMAFLVIPMAYTAENVPKIYIHRDIVSIITPATTISNVYAEETYAVQSMFHKYRSNYDIHLLNGTEATFQRILDELGLKPIYFHLATNGSSGPSLKAYDKFFSPANIYSGYKNGPLTTTQLIFLSACYSLQNYNSRDPNTNFGFLFVNLLGVDYVIGSKGPINTIAAYLVAIEFYDFHLRQGYGFRDAFNLAYQDVYNKISRFLEEGIMYIIEKIVSWFGAGLGIIAYKLVESFIREHVHYFVVSYLTDALTSMSNLLLYDASFNPSGGGGGGGNPPVIM